VPAAFQGSECVRGELKRRKYQIKARYQVRADALLRLGLYKILYYLEAFVHDSIILSLPPPTCIARTIAILLHVYCAIYDAPPTPLVYAMHHTILVIAILCKGQATAQLGRSDEIACLRPRARDAPARIHRGPRRGRPEGTARQGAVSEKAGGAR